MQAVYRTVRTAAAMTLLAGCATHPGNRADAILGTMQQAQESLNACILDTYNDPQFEPLGTHMPMNMRGVTMDQLTDERFATDAEIQMLKLYEESAQPCRKSYVDELRPVVPAVAALTATAYMRNEEILSDLMQKRVSWGGYISGVVGNYRELNLKVDAEMKRTTSDLKPEGAADWLSWIGGR
jgi:hypothetical protein